MNTFPYILGVFCVLDLTVVNTYIYLLLLVCQYEQYMEKNVFVVLYITKYCGSIV